MKTVSGWAYPDIDEFMAKEMQADGSYQGSHLTAAMRHVTDRRLALDGGAHVGTWSRPMSGLFDAVVAVEPSPDTFEALVENMRAFGCANVACRHVALGAAPGWVSMTWDQRAADLANTGGRYVQEQGDIPRITIDSLALPALGFLKLDVEGAEVDAIQGGAETIRQHRPIILFENKGFCRRYGHPKDGPQQLLTRLGYHQLEVAGKDLIYGPR